MIEPPLGVAVLLAVAIGIGWHISEVCHFIQSFRGDEQ